MAKHRNNTADCLLLSTHTIIWLALIVTTSVAQCPWQREVLELQSSCLCAYNLGHELSVQCDMVNFQKLLSSLDTYARNTPLDLLYVNNSTILKLDDYIFENLKIHNIQLSGCKIKSVSINAFHGQEESLRNLNLQENEITEIPIESLKTLSNLALLDLSRNRITMVPDGAFKTLKKLATLKLSDNNVTLSERALEGLENSLKNLNLKGTHQHDVPKTIRGLKKLAFLDLSQNGLQELPGENGESSFEGLDSLTALNLERNVIQTLGPTAFEGVKNTLSSLSLLNNLLADFPTEAMSVLKELRVLDIGFNLLTQLPEDAFRGNPSITLLALDGNPLSTVPYKALSHLNTTLRGLSLGGRFLHCDCRLRWVTEWIRNGDLQVTSRERNPQFCGSPPRFRDRGFYNIKPEELTCPGEKLKPSSNKDTNKGEVTALKPEDVIGTNTGVIHSLIPPGSRSTARPNVPTTQITQTTPKSTTSTIAITQATTEIEIPKNLTTQLPTSISTEITTNSTQKSEVTSSKNMPMPPWRQNSKPQQQHQRPPLVIGPRFPTRTRHDDTNEVIVKNAFRQDNSVIIQWTSETANILGFRVVYRLFGDKSFKQGPPLEASEREFKIKNVPSQECIVVCVISLEEINVTPENVPYSQCREVRTVGSSTSNMDKITIAASAAICGTIVIAVIVFIAASRRRSRKMHDLQQQQLGVKSGLPISGLPVNCCTASSPGGHLSSLATLNAYNTHKEWDQISAYSGRSVQRPRIYTIDQPNSINATMLPDDMRSHGGSHFSNKGGSGGAKTRSLADGQSQHSFSNHSGRYLAPSAFPSNLVTTRQELRHSRQSLAASDRMSRTSYPPSQVTTATATAGSTGGGGRRTRPRSRTREQRPGSRYSTAGSTHTLNNYCDTSDNWTDHDMDIYMARNPTTRGGLVPL